MSGYPRPPSRGDTDVVARRIFAQIIDTVFVGFIIGLFLAVSGQNSRSLFLFLGVLAALVYWFALEGLTDGKTVGKVVTGIKVVKEDGSKCSIGASITRNLLDIIDGLFYYLVGFLVMAFSDERQRIGDRLAGTMVVRAEPTDTASETESVDTNADTF